MSILDLANSREVITAAATAEVPEDKPAICGTVTLHCIDDGEPLRLSMPMLDALLLLNSLRAIEKEFSLQVWSAQVGCSLNSAEYMTAQLQQQLDEDDLIVPSSLN
ncbi:MAG: hypothetical protein GX535_10255 [Xanthomonadaceae bacterium]|nr:hypothetical protein [Xanthomonadaceae bacterium]